MKICLKYGLIGLVIWLVLFILFLVGAKIGINPCIAEPNNPMIKSITYCHTPFQQNIFSIIGLVGFIGGAFTIFGAIHPLFYVGSALTFFLWGVLIGFIIKKIKKKKK
ncbi:MAG: hypothetical protein ABIH65_03505 [Nanoarchaeota archaeon]